jgi:RNA-directed DNA polymerase
MRKFGLELHPEKTRMIEFGRFAEDNRKRRREGIPETFDFLGFTHICGKTRKGNWFTVRRQTIKKRLRGKQHGDTAGASQAVA